ncbi:MAG: response regulator transcription factor [Tissierellia bacterium]|nr:response regulator transcription factor [Tissierellia bacterium]
MAEIYIIDDEEGIRSLVKTALERDGHSVIMREYAQDLKPSDFQNTDLILLDIMMPGLDGRNFCKGIRNEVDCPILFLTAKTLEEDLVEGLALGADDYIKKPFHISELRARVAAHLRRETRDRQQSLILGSVRFHLLEKQVIINGQALPLTKSEYEICELLARHRGQVFSLEHILEEVMGYDTDSDISAIRVHVKNIRKKFSLWGLSPIETIWGVGYLWK